MDIKSLANTFISFTTKRILEIFGIIFVLFGILLLIALTTYSPDDPNFIFPSSTKINNLLGFQGSFVSDLLFQSFGAISYLLPITFIFTGINIFKLKQIFFSIENIFFAIIYILFGTIFLSLFYNESFELHINGNGGFVGKYLSNSFLRELFIINKNISFYVLIFLTFSFFLLSINFKLNSFFQSIKKIYSYFLTKEQKNYTNKNEIIEEYIPQDQIKNLIQEDLPFIKENKNNDKNKQKYKLPEFKLLKIPSKSERNEASKNQNYDSNFLEKILLDFGVNGKIKKASQGPVVTLNEFEPAAGVKVSKIINLSDDIARNTSSESARISTIPGSSTIGIELPNPSRENVYLSEILDNSDFKKRRSITNCFRKKYFRETYCWRFIFNASSINCRYNRVWKICMY